MGQIKMGMSKAARNVLISAAVILVLLVLGGVLYTYFGSGTPITRTPAPAPAVTSESAIKPTKPTASEQESAAIEFLTSPVSAGSDASISVKTVATSTCKISVTYSNVPANDSSLSPKVADDYGNVNWDWTIRAGTPAGKGSVSVTCVYNGRSAVVVGDLVVTTH